MTPAMLPNSSAATAADSREDRVAASRRRVARPEGRWVVGPSNESRKWADLSVPRWGGDGCVGRRWWTSVSDAEDSGRSVLASGSELRCEAGVRGEETSLWSWDEEPQSEGGRSGESANVTEWPAPTPDAGRVVGDEKMGGIGAAGKVAAKQLSQARTGTVGAVGLAESRILYC